MMEKFTKGPWRISEHGAIKSEHAKTATGAVSVSGLSNPMYQCQEAKANAALIAVAPEMYEMLKHVNSLIVSIKSPLYEDIERLLAKARGEQ